MPYGYESRHDRYGLSSRVTEIAFYGQEAIIRSCPQSAENMPVNAYLQEKDGSLTEIGLDKPHRRHPRLTDDNSGTVAEIKRAGFCISFTTSAAI